MSNLSAVSTPSDVVPAAPGAPCADDLGGTDSVTSQVISFGIGVDQYGVDITAVREIKGWTGITPLPRQPPYVRGVLNLRGVIVPIVDLRCRFGQGLTESSPLHIVIVVQVEEKLVGLLADRVLDIVSFGASEIKVVPHVAQMRGQHFLSGLLVHDDAMIAIVDIPSLLSLGLHETEASWTGEVREAAENPDGDSHD